MKKKLMILLLTFCCAFPVFGMEIENLGDRNQLQLEAHVNRNDRVLWVFGLLLSGLAVWLGYNTYRVRKLANELESKEAELKAVQKELQDSQIELVKILVNKEAELDAKDKELKESQVALAEQQQQLKEGQIQLLAKQEQQRILLKEWIDAQTDLNRREGNIKVYIADLKEQHSYLGSIVEKLIALNVERADLNDRLRVLEKARVIKFADKVYAKWKERTKYALVEYDVAEEQNNFNLQRDYSIH
jgi:chromosome segregation ATPase